MPTGRSTPTSAVQKSFTHGTDPDAKARVFFLIDWSLGTLAVRKMGPSSPLSEYPVFQASGFVQEICSSPNLS